MAKMMHKIVNILSFFFGLNEILECLLKVECIFLYLKTLLLLSKKINLFYVMIFNEKRNLTRKN